MKKNRLLLLSFALIVIFSNSCKKDELVDLPSVGFTYSPASGVLPVHMSFVASVPSSNTVSWDFGDGQTGTGLMATHTYTAEGLYKVTISSTTPEGLTIKRADTINVYPYTQLSISQIDVTLPNPAYIHYKVYNSVGAMIFSDQFASFSTNGTFLSSSPVPPLIINDLEHNLKVEFWNYYNVVSTISICPSTYFQSTLPFPANLSGSDSQGRTVKLYVSWN